MPPFQLALFFPGTYTATQNVWHMTFLTNSITFNQGAWIAASLRVATNGTLVFGINKNTVQFATLTWANAQTVPTFSVIAATTFLANDVLDITRVSGTDTAAARLAITLLGVRA